MQTPQYSKHFSTPGVFYRAGDFHPPPGHCPFTIYVAAGVKTPTTGEKKCAVNDQSRCGGAAKTVYPQIARICTDFLDASRGNVYHEGNSQGGRRGKGGREGDFNEQLFWNSLFLLIDHCCYPQIARIFTDFLKHHERMFTTTTQRHNGNSQGGGRGKGGRDFNEQRTTSNGQCWIPRFIDRWSLIRDYRNFSPYLCCLCGSKMAVTAWRSYATLRLIHGLAWAIGYKKTERVKPLRLVNYIGH